MCPKDKEKQRVFFALWPQPPVLERLDGLADEMGKLAGGRRTKRENLHLTLAFIGDVDPDQVEQLIRLGDALWPMGPDLPPLTIDRMDWWRHNRILWCGGDLPAPWQTEISRLRARLAANGFPIDAREFIAHVTLSRKVKHKPAPLRFAPIVWPALEIRLAVSRPVEDGVRYDRIGAWRSARA